MPHYADTSNYSPAEISLWEKLIEKEGVEYHTAKNLLFTYTIRGNELFISRKAKSITRATVNMAYKRAVELMELGCAITGPKMLGVYGASYLYAVFKEIGVIHTPPTTVTPTQAK